MRIFLALEFTWFCYRLGVGLTMLAIKPCWAKVNAYQKLLWLTN